MITGKEIAKAALPWLGTPHVNQARVRGRGVDCGMLLIAALEDSGAIKSGSITIAPYSNEWHLHHSEEWFLSYVKKYCEPVKYEEMQEGDFLLFNMGGVSRTEPSTSAIIRSYMPSYSRASSCPTWMM